MKKPGSAADLSHCRAALYSINICSLHMRRSHGSDFNDMTIFEIRPHRCGWQCVEAPGVVPYFVGDCAKESAIGYAKAAQRTVAAKSASTTQPASWRRPFPSMNALAGCDWIDKVSKATYA